MATNTTAARLTPRKGTIRSARPRVMAMASTQSGEQPGAHGGHAMGRRHALSAGLATVLLSAGTQEASAKMVDKKIKAANMSSFQKKDLMADFLGRCEAAFAKVLTKEDAPGLLRLLILDAATYDASAKTGGVNGSVALSEECPKELKGLVDKLQQAREAIKKDGPAGQDMLSMADALVLGAKIATELSWDATKRASLSANNYDLSKRYGSSFQVMRLGRIDASTADAKVPVPATTASPEEVFAFMSRLGVKEGEGSGPFAAKAPFWERPTFLLWTASTGDAAASEEAFGQLDGFASWKSKYDKSRSTTYRDDYEIDFAEFFNKLANLGAKFEKSPYLYDITMQVPDRF